MKVSLDQKKISLSNHITGKLNCKKYALIKKKSVLLKEMLSQNGSLLKQFNMFQIMKLILKQFEI